MICPITNNYCRTNGCGEKCYKRDSLGYSNETQHDANRLLPAVQRPKIASEALKLLKEGIQVEMETGKVFDFMRYVEKAERNFSFRCYVNEFTEGYTVLKHGR